MQTRRIIQLPARVRAVAAALEHIYITTATDTHVVAKESWGRQRARAARAVGAAVVIERGHNDHGLARHPALPLVADGRRVWRAGWPVANFAATNTIQAVAWHPRRPVVALADGALLHVWDLGLGAATTDVRTASIRTIRTRTPATSLTWTDAGQLVVAAADAVRVFGGEAPAGRVAFRTDHHDSRVLAQPGATLAAVTYGSSLIKLVDVNTGRPAMVWAPDHDVDGWAWHPSGRWLAAGGGRAVTVWEPAMGRAVWRRATDTPVADVAWGPNGDTLLVAAGAEVAIHYDLLDDKK